MKDYTNFNDSKISLSEFNEAGLQIMRLHDCWNDCKSYIKNGKYDKWKWVLDAIWVELYPDVIHSKKGDGYIKQYNLCNKRIIISNNKNQLYFALVKKQEFLKKLQDDVGKGSKRSQTYSDNFMT